MIFLDLSVAFDSIDVKTILPKKLEHYGADEKTVNFFRTFFNDRKHFIEWNGVKSQENDLFGVSICQGSTLGPPCFNAYTRCYKNVIEEGDEKCGEDEKCDEECDGTVNKKDGKTNTSCKGLYFADDTLLILASDCPEDLFKRGNIELEKTRLYMNANKLLINDKKTQFLLYKPKGKRMVNIDEKL